MSARCNGLCETAAGCCCPSDAGQADALQAAIDDAKRRVRLRAAASWRQGMAAGLWIGTLLGGFVGALAMVIAGSLPT